MLDVIKNGMGLPVFTGTPDECKQWLGKNIAWDPSTLQVCVGRTMVQVSVAKYLVG